MLFPGLVLALLALESASEDWPQFRGPGGNGVSSGPAIVEDFSSTKSVFWSVKVPSGKSSPIVTGGRIFLTASEGSTLIILAINAGTGAVEWTRKVSAARTLPSHKLNAPASQTPVTDGQRIYVWFGDFGVICYSLQGEELWRNPILFHAGVHGHAASPVLAGDRLILAAGADVSGRIVALDTNTGKIVWDRKSARWGAAYSTPAVYSEGGNWRILVQASFAAKIYDVSTGEVIAWFEGLTYSPIATPIVLDGVAFLTARSVAEESAKLPQWSDLLKADKNGDGKLDAAEFPQDLSAFTQFDDGDGILSAEEYQTLKKLTSRPGGLFAVPLAGNGDLSTKSLWRHEKSLPDVASPLVAKGVVYVPRQGGEEIFATPAAVDGNLYVRTASTLYSFGAAR